MGAALRSRLQTQRGGKTHSRDYTSVKTRGGTSSSKPLVCTRLYRKDFRLDLFLKNKVRALFAGVKHRIWKKLFPRRRFNAECPICTDEFEAEDGTFLLDCNADGGHVYHLECLQGMIAA